MAQGGNKGGGFISWYGAVEQFGDMLIWALLRIMLFAIVLIILLSLLGCGLTKAVAILPGDQGTQCAANMVGNVVQIGGTLLLFTTSLFDTVIVRYLFTAGTYLNPGNAFGTGIAAVWTILRDIVNLVLIGGLVWTSVSMILRTGQQVGKIIVQILIAALLVNFSYFFAGAILDASHFSARIIYQEAIFNGENISLDATDPNRKQEVRPGLMISERFMDATRLSGLIYGKLDLDKVTDFGIAFTFGLFALLFLLLTAWIFLSLAGLFLQRFVVILILLMTAPIGILAFTDIGSAKELGKGWWAALWSQAIFPPVALIGIAASLKVLENASASVLRNASTDYGILALFNEDAFTSAAGKGPWAATWDLITIYILGIGLLYMSMRIATNIARQEPLKVPTTGQFYGAYRKIAPAVAKGVAGAGKALANFPIPGQSFYRNLGDFLTVGPGRRGITWPTEAGLQGQERWNRNKNDFERNHRRAQLATAARRKAEEDGASIEEIERLRENENAQWDIAASILPRLGEDYRRRLRSGDIKIGTPSEAEQKAAGVKVTDKDQRDVTGETIARSEEGEIGATNQRIAGRQRVSQVQPGVPQRSPQIQNLIDAVKDEGRKEAARDALAYRLERQENKNILEDRRLSAELVRGLREVGHVTSLPPAALSHENVAPQLNLTEVVELGSDTENISNDQFKRIMDRVGDEVHEAFRSHPAAKLRPSRPPRGGG